MEPIAATSERAGALSLSERLKRKTVLGCWNAWQRLDAILPRRVRFLVATLLGEIVYWVLPDKRAATLENLARVLGPGAPASVVRLAAKRSFRNYLKYLTEFTHLPRWAAEDLEGLVEQVRGWENVEDALADNNGAIFVSPHFGNWDVAGWYFGRRYAFSAVVEPLNPPELDALVQGWRKAKQIGIIPLALAARGILKSLQRGGIVALVVDRPTHTPREGVAVRFFGELTWVPSGAAHFALRTGAPVIAAGVWRTPSNRYAAFALPPMRFTGSRDDEHDVQRVMQRIMEDMETIIRAHPDQWYMFRRMWPGRLGWRSILNGRAEPHPLHPSEATGAT